MTVCVLDFSVFVLPSFCSAARFMSSMNPSLTKLNDGLAKPFLKTPP